MEPDEEPAKVIFLDADTRAKNIATNGRWFCALLCACNLVAFSAGLGRPHLSWAILLAVIPGLACIADSFNGCARDVFVIFIYAMAAVGALFSMLSVGV